MIRRNCSPRSFGRVVIIALLALISSTWALAIAGELSYTLACG